MQFLAYDPVPYALKIRAGQVAARNLILKPYLLKITNSMEIFANRNWPYNHPMHMEHLASSCFYNKLLSWTLVEGYIAIECLLLR